MKHIAAVVCGAARAVGLARAHAEQIEFGNESGTLRAFVDTDNVYERDGMLFAFGTSVTPQAAAPYVYAVTGCNNGFGSITFGPEKAFDAQDKSQMDSKMWAANGGKVFDGIARGVCLIHAYQSRVAERRKQQQPSTPPTPPQAPAMLTRM